MTDTYSQVYLTNLDDQLNISINNNNNVHKNINIMEKLLFILNKLENINILVSLELLDEAIIYKAQTEENIKISQNLIDRISSIFSIKYNAEQKPFNPISNIIYFNAELAENIKTQTENIAIQTKLTLHDLEEQMEYNINLLSYHNIIKKLVEEACGNVIISKNITNDALNKLDELKKKEKDAHEAYICPKNTEHY